MLGVAWCLSVYTVGRRSTKRVQPHNHRPSTWNTSNDSTGESYGTHHNQFPQKSLEQHRHSSAKASLSNCSKTHWQDGNNVSANNQFLVWLQCPHLATPARSALQIVAAARSRPALTCRSHLERASVGGQWPALGLSYMLLGQTVTWQHPCRVRTVSRAEADRRQAKR